MNPVEVFNLVASIFSIVTGVVALSLSVVFFLSAKKAETNTNQYMVEIKSATSQLSRLSMRLLDRLTTALVAPRPTEERLVDALRDVSNLKTLSESSTDEIDSKTTKAQLEQFRVDNLVTAFYYAATTNITTQGLMPAAPDDSDSYKIYKYGLDQSQSDFKTMSSWILNTDEYEKKLAASPVKHLYDRARAAEVNVKSTEQYYKDRGVDIQPT
jgi:hypothetical protein